MIKVYCKTCGYCAGTKHEDGRYYIEFIDKALGYIDLVGKSIPSDAKCVECGSNLDILEVE